MKMRILFEGFSKDKNIYNLCQGYWSRVIKRAISQEAWKKGIFLKNAYDYGTKIYDANPIMFYLGKDGKAVRVILYPDQEYDERESDTENYEISTWEDSYTYDDVEYKELVITLFMTENSISISKNLIKRWLSSQIDNNFALEND